MARRTRDARPLATYEEKRDFRRTPEPPPRRRRRRAGRSFCVQEHAASRLHFDLRLELDGVLLSWSVPKGPSLDPGEKRLAIRTEDHPLEYGDFEGVIPEGEYGGGTVLLWDRGDWEPEGDPREQLEKGRLSFRLRGRKLAGAWALVRTGSAARGEKEEWLLVKREDEHARPGARLLAERPESVSSGRSLAEIAAEEGGTRRQVAAARRAEAAVSARADGGAQPLRARAVRPSELPAARRAALPGFVAPELATLVTGAPAGDGWLHEIKLDGYRMLLRVEEGVARLFSRAGHSWTAKLPTIAGEARRLACRKALVDGELVLHLSDGRTSFEAMRRALGTTRERELVLQAFDLIHLDGYDLSGEPVERRKEALRALLEASAAGDAIRFTDHVVGGGPRFRDEACRLGLEGVMSKRIGSLYRSGRGKDWLKTKCVQRQELVVAGYSPSASSAGGVGSLVLAVREEGCLRYAGRVGTGFSDRDRRELEDRLDSLRAGAPAVDVPPRDRELRDAVWVRPELVAEVAFTEWTRDGKLRHPSFLGLRADADPRQVVREVPQPPPGTKGRRPRMASGTSPIRVAGVRLTNPGRILWDEQGVSKRELAEYYEAVAERMLPHARDRLLTLLRCPRGAGESCFYQKHASEGQPDEIGVMEVQEERKADTYMYVTSAAGLVALVQMGVLEVHLWGSRRDRLDRPDRMVFDLDPGPGLSFGDVASAARDLRGLLGDAGLASFAMTTGGKGLHVVVPLERRHDFDEVRAFARSVAKGLEREEPKRFVAEASKAKRQRRIFVDYLRNARGATAIAPFSTRARPGAPVATPLRWDELRPGLRGDRWSVKSVLRRLGGQEEDPWSGYDGVRQRISAAARARFDGPRSAGRSGAAPSGPSGPSGRGGRSRTRGPSGKRGPR